MSGGTAYLLDLVPERMNKDSLEKGELRLEPLDAEDADIVRGLLIRHVEETESVLAASLLEDFDATARRMTKVLPRDYAAVLDARASAAEAGLDPDGAEAWTRILEVTGG